MSTIPQRLGNYELQRLLGSGSVGKVWKSYDMQHRHDVAIKIFYSDLQSDPDFMNRLLSKGQSLASLRHPNIIQILDANMVRPKEANSTIAYMVMDYIEGPTLADIIQNTSRKRAFPVVSDIVSLFTQLGAAIDYAHEQGIIHGNIKPANILLRLPPSNEMKQSRITRSSPMPLNYREAVLTDFGIARSTNGSVRNSALYMSPEQAKGLPPTRHSDIYALGIILYEICTGVPPFRSESPAVLMMQHMHMQPIPPTLINTNIPSELSAVILRALAKDSSTSFSSASQMATALADVCSVHTVLNDAIVESREPAYAIAPKGYRMDTRSTEALGKSTRPLSTLLGVSTLPAHASQLAQLQYALSEASGARFNTSRSLPVIPLRPATVGAPERVSTSPHMVTTGQIPARAVIRTGTSAMDAFNRLPQHMRNDASSEGTTPLNTTPVHMRQIHHNPSTSGPLVTPLSTIPDPMGRAFSTSEKDLETPPAMPVIPFSPVTTSLSTTPSVPQLPLSLPPPRKVKKLPAIYIWLTVALLLVIIGSVVGMLYWLRWQPTTSTHAAVGQISFQNDGYGQNDMLRIELQNIPDPPSGESYYAWLVIDDQQNTPTPMLLGKLPISSGQVNFLYAGDVHHSDLLASVSDLLITEEDASGTPSFPSSKEVYTVSFAQAVHPSSVNQMSALNAVHDLLSNDSTLNKLGISGSLAQWLLRDTSKVWLWASNAQDYWQGTGTNSSAVNFIRGQIVHIVDVLEGKQIDSRDAPIARVALLQSNTLTSDYLDAALSRLNTIASDSTTTEDAKARAHTLAGELVQLKNWLQKVHQDALQLLNLTDQQFTQPQTQSLLDDMAFQANDAYNGQNNLSTNAAQHAGMAQIYSTMQSLATFDVVPFKAQS